MNCLIVFAKEPILGQVKTRLAKSVSDESALKLYQAFLNDTLDLARSIDVDQRVLAWAAEGEPTYLKRTASDFDLVEQAGVDLGERMHQAFVQAQQSGARKTAIIGSDAPSLPNHFIEDAFHALDHHDMVLGPTDDGGYYLIGLKQTDKALFAETDWSVETTRRQTLRKARDLGKVCMQLPFWFDVDTVDDLTRLKESLTRDPEAARHTWKTLQEMPSL